MGLMCCEVLMVAVAAVAPALAVGCDPIRDARRAVGAAAWVGGVQLFAARPRPRPANEAASERGRRAGGRAAGAGRHAVERRLGCAEGGAGHRPAVPIARVPRNARGTRRARHSPSASRIDDRGRVDTLGSIIQVQRPGVKAVMARDQISALDSTLQHGSRSS